MIGAFGRGNRRSQPYRRGAREPGMALRNMMQGRPGFQPNPMALERETMKHQRGSLGAVLRSIPQGRGAGVGPLATQGMARGREAAMGMRQARGIGQYRDRGGIPTRDEYRASHGHNFRQRHPYRSLSDPSDASRGFGPPPQGVAVHHPLTPPGVPGGMMASPTTPGQFVPAPGPAPGAQQEAPYPGQAPPPLYPGEDPMAAWRRVELARRSAPVPRF